MLPNIREAEEQQRLLSVPPSRHILMPEGFSTRLSVCKCTVTPGLCCVRLRLSYGAETLGSRSTGHGAQLCQPPLGLRCSCDGFGEAQ